MERQAMERTNGTARALGAREDGLEGPGTAIEVVIGWWEGPGEAEGPAPRLPVPFGTKAPKPKALEDVLHAAHLAPGTAFVLGSGKDVDFVAPASVLGADRVVLIDEEGTVRVPAGATRLGSDAAGAPLMFALGSFVVRVRTVREGKVPTGPARMDRAPFAYVGGTMALAAVCLTLFALTPPASAAISLDHIDQRRRLIEFATVVQELPPPEPVPPSTGGGEPGQAHAGDAGRMGDEAAPRRDRRAGVRGDAPREERQLSRDQQRDQTRTAGILGVLPTALGGGSMISSPFGAETAIGSDPMDALGHLLGDRLGTADGSGGLGPNGTGRGGGGDGEGTVGLGDRGLGTIGDCAPGADCRGGRGDYGRTAALTSERRRVRVPRLGGRVESLQGSLSREAIRRTINRHRNEVKFCYEQGLQGRPDLEGRVVTRFLIGPTGTVMQAGVQSSDLGDGRVERCIATAVRRWTFPQPEDGGVVRVSYPFLLHLR
ncbi:MAG: AgmX/PglI C-terminal domain-containing protein [Myxococcota bacterium]